MAPIMSRGRFSVITITLLLTLAWSIRTRSQPDHATEPTFVGAQACAACHRQIHADWKSGRHSKMVQPATASSVLADFSKDVTLKGNRYRLRVANGEYFITESYLTGKEQEHRVEYTLGSRRIQHYLTTIEHGRMIVLPPSWDVQRHEWFDNMEIVRPDENDQKPVQQWNKNCVGCHVSQQENNYRPTDRTYATKWTDFGTSCERCHGPGSAHVQVYSRPERGGAVADRSIVRPTRLDPKTSSMICAQCHSLRDIVAPGYTAGADYYDYFQPVLEYGPRKDSDPTYWADARPRRFSNDAIGLWESECFLRGGATCTSCHRDPHVPDIDRNAQLAAQQCALYAMSPGSRHPVDRAHTPSRRQRRQLVCRMPHAEDRRQHQVDDARPHDRPAGPGEHGRVRHPQRLHRVPQGQTGDVGGEHARALVAARPPREACRTGRGLHRRPGGRPRALDRLMRSQAATTVRDRSSRPMRRVILAVTPMPARWLHSSTERRPIIRPSVPRRDLQPRTTTTAAETWPASAGYPLPR